MQKLPHLQITLTSVAICGQINFSEITHSNLTVQEEEDYNKVQREMDKRIKLLKEYFEKQPSVILAFLFGSRVKGLDRKISDWDIAVYFKPEKYLELEAEREYQEEHKIWSDLVDILKTDDVDFLTLNRTAPELVFSILNSGVPLLIKDRDLYIELLCKTHYEAIDFREFAFDFWEIAERSKSLTKGDKFRILKRLKFLEKEWEEFDKFKKLTWLEYRSEPDQRRNVERWIENLVIAALDIAKIILAAKKELLPEGYKETLMYFGAEYFNESFGRSFSKFAEFRNILAHEYLDIKWRQIKNFIKEAEKLYPQFVEKVKKMSI